MFIYSMRANTIKFIGVLCVALTVLVTLIVFVPTYTAGSDVLTGADGVTQYSYDKVKSASDVSSFLSQFGWKVGSEPIEIKEVTVPAEFDKVYAAYNELQKGQGLNLTKYRGKEVTRYTYEVVDYPGYEGRVYANVLVYRGRVIGGDICSADVTGFVHGFEKPMEE